MTVLDTFRFEAHSPAMNKSAVIIAAIAASISFASVAHANGDHEPTCGYDQVCEEPTTTIQATDEPPAPTTTVAPTSTIGAINGPATVATTIPAFVCNGTMVADVCVQPTTTTLLQGGDDCMDDGTTRWSMQPCGAVADVGTAALPITGSRSQTVALVGLVLFALAGLLYGVRWVFKRS